MSDKSVKKKRIWLVNIYTGSKTVTIGKDKRTKLLNKTVGFKIMDKSSDRDATDLLNFYSQYYNINKDTKFEIASDACKRLKRISKEVPNSTWIYSKFHATKPLFVHHTYEPRRWNKKISKKEIGYYDFLKGFPNKVLDYYKQRPYNWEAKAFITQLKNSQKGIEAWKTAKYGCNAESMASEVKQILGDKRRILGEKSFINLMKRNGWVQLP